MPNLYTFGCSYTEGFNIETTASYIEYKKYRGDFPKSWPEILSDKLNMNLKNFGRGAAGNQEIFTKFCKNCDEFKNDDIVIVQWSFMERHRFAIGNGPDDWDRYGPGRVDTSKISQATNDEICVNRTLRPYRVELYDYMKIMDRLSQLIGFKLYYWTFLENFIYNQRKEFLLQEKYLLCDKIKDQHYHAFRVAQDNGSQTILEETKGVVNDLHLGEKGHQVLSDLFLNHILNFPNN